MAVCVKPIRFLLLHPSVALTYFAGQFVLLFICGHPVLLAAAVVGAMVLAFFFAGAEAMKKQLRFLLPLSAGYGLLNPLLTRRGATVLFYLLDNAVTLEALLYGLSQALLLIGVIILFVSFNRVIDQSAFLYLTARFAPRTAFVTDMALRASARFAARTVELAGIMQTKGLSITEGRLRLRFSAAARLFRALVVRGLEEGMEVAEVLKARDYGSQRRSHYQAYRFAMRDGLCLLLLAGLFMAALYGFAQGAGRFSFYPRLGSLALSGYDAALLGCCLLYIGFPLLCQLPGHPRIRRGSAVL